MPRKKNEPNKKSTPRAKPAAGKTAPEKKIVNVTMLQKIPRIRRGGDNCKKSETRKRFLYFFEQSFGNISASCEYAGVDRRTYYRWMNSSSRINLKFREAVLQIKPLEKQLDFAEAALMQRVANGDTAAIMFTLKTRGKERGYGEKTQDLEYQLVLRAVARLEVIINQQIKNNPNFKPDVRRLAELAAGDFGVKPEAIEKEFIKRQPQMIEGIQ